MVSGIPLTLGLRTRLKDPCVNVGAASLKFGGIVEVLVASKDRWDDYAGLEVL